MRAYDGDMFDDELPCDLCGNSTASKNGLCGDCDEMIAVLTFGLDVDQNGRERLY